MNIVADFILLIILYFKLSLTELRENGMPACGFLSISRRPCLHAANQFFFEKETNLPILSFRLGYAIKMALDCNCAVPALFSRHMCQDSSITVSLDLS